MSHARAVAVFLLLASFVIAMPVHGFAQNQNQNPAQTNQETPPVLPETRVEANPPATGNVPDNSGIPSPQAGTQQGIGGASIFDSPPTSGYGASSSTTGSIINIPDADLPATVNVILSDALSDQHALQFDDVVRNAGGVISSGDRIFADRIFIRGLEVGTRDYRKDGFLDPTAVPRDFQNVERIEIFKGPASVLYGAGDASGMVNVITKKPLYDRFADFGFEFGSWQRARYTIDANGYSASDRLLYRLNVAQEDADGFVDFDFLSRTQVAPVFTWIIDDCSSLTWNGEWHRHDSIGFQGTPAVNGDPLFLPPSRYVGEPANDFFNSEEFRQSLVYRREINDDWWFSLGGYSLFYDFPSSTTAAAAQVFPNPPLFVRSRNDFVLEDEQSHSAIANLGGETCIGGMLHRSVFGVEYAYFDSASRLNSGVLFGPFDVSNPTYLNPPPVPVFTADFPVFRQQRVGGYFQDLVSINPFWKLLGGVRLDTVNFEFERDIGFGEVETQQDFDRASPRAGVVYQPFGDEDLSFFYAYGTSFTPPGGGIYLNSDLLPILGQSHEAGVKSMLVDGLYFSASGFHTVRENDAFNVQSIFLVQVGEVRSQGAELNLVGTITDRWSLISNYTYTDTRLSDPNPAFDGRRARNIPFNSANFWSRYDFYHDCCKTFGAALGFVYLGDRPADLENDLFLPGFGRWDAGMYYSVRQWSASVYLENLFDLQYAASSVDEMQIFQGAPFNVRATVTYSY